MNTNNLSEFDVIRGVRTAVFRGRKHIRKQMPCQDAYAIGTSKNGLTVIAVADGVSSSPHSEEAARTATKAALDFWKVFGTYFDDKEGVFSVLQASMNYALLETDKIRDDSREAHGFETTLSIMVINSQKKEMYFSYAGDGGIYILKRDGTVQLVTEIMRDTEGCVYALSEGPAKWNYGAEDISDVRSILMVTDGVSDVIREEGNDLTTAKYFMEETSSEKAYRDTCRKILSDEPFLDMDDDAAIVLYTVGNVKRMPWDDDTTEVGNTQNPVTEEDEPEALASASQEACSGIRSSIKNLLSNIKGRRKK